MKNILTIFLLMTAYSGTCQTTDIHLPEVQGIEIYKGLEQGKFLKEILHEKDNLITELENQIIDDSRTIAQLQQIIANLEIIKRNNQNYIEFQEQKFELEKKQLKNKRFGVGLVSGYGLSHEFKQGTFAGVGLSYTIFRF